LILDHARRLAIALAVDAELAHNVHRSTAILIIISYIITIELATSSAAGAAAELCCMRAHMHTQPRRGTAGAQQAAAVVMMTIIA
jgi:hypothetical protein